MSDYGIFDQIVGENKSFVEGLPNASSGSNFSPLSAGALALGAGGLGYMIAQGPGQLPQQFVQAEQQAPDLYAKGNTLYGEGQQLAGQGAAALEMARKGELTPEQQASLNQENQRLINLARQTYANMGRSPDLDTSYVSTQGNIGQQIMVDAQAAIQSTIALGTSELSAGSNFTAQGLAYSNAATQILTQAGQAQIAQDTAYKNSLTAAFTAVGQIAATVGKALIL